MMIPSALVKCSIAIILFVQVSAFMSPARKSARKCCTATFPTDATVVKHQPFPTQQVSTIEYQRDISCYATSKRQSSPGKTAFGKKSKVGGIGGLNVGRLTPNSKNKKTASSTPKKSIKKNVKTNKKSTKSIGTDKSPKADLDWSKIILAFLTPWRNPNSIFLYMLIVVSVLGKLNENPQ